MRHPTGLDLTEMALQTLSEAGFAPRPASQLAMQALRAVVAHGDQRPGRRQRHVRPRSATRTCAPSGRRSRSLSPDKYPALVAHADAMTYCPDVDEFFDLGIDLYVAGVRGLAPVLQG